MSRDTEIVQPGRMESHDDSRCNEVIYVILISSFIVLGGIAIIILVSIKPRHDYKDEYGVVFDAGSSHTSVFVYKWSGHERLKGTAVPVDEVYTNEVKPGLSSFIDNPEKAGDSLKDLVQQALNNVPKDVRNSTPVFLGATAGMRLVYEVNSTTSNRIMSSVREVLSRSGFQFSDQNVEIISGEHEGAFGWITVNYLKHVLQQTNSKEPSAGALDLGGASTQISFVAGNASRVTENYHLYGRDYPIYTATYLCYGMNEIYRRFLAELAKSANYTTDVPNPCSSAAINVTTTYLWGTPCSCKPSQTVNHNFTFIGSLNSTECNRQVTNLFHFNDTCPSATVFSRDHQPKLGGNFFAFSGYFYTAQALGVSLSPTKDEFKKGYEAVCNEKYEQLLDKEPFAGGTSIPLCFAGQFVYALLTHGYGFNNESWNISFKKKVDNKDVGWSLGYMINATNLIPKNAPRNIGLRDEVVIPSVACSGLLVLIGFILCIKCCIGRRYRHLKNGGYTPI